MLILKLKTKLYTNDDFATGRATETFISYMRFVPKFKSANIKRAEELLPSVY